MRIQTARLSITVVISMLITSTCLADELKQLMLLKKAYPEFIKGVNNNSLTWADGEHININDDIPGIAVNSPTLLEQLKQPAYPANKVVRCETYIPTNDPGRIRNETFFAKMYGRDESHVKRNLDTVYWMPGYFDHQYPLLITRLNGVNIKLKRISNQLELLVKEHPDFLKYFDKPSGTFYWRHIQNSKRRSPHSFGIAIDINSSYANYWIWDTGIKENKINQIDVIPYKNYIPCEIVSIFENNGFIWGGKWQHYDTMHFEYRPELLLR